MKDLKVYYDDHGRINSDLDKQVEKLAKDLNLNFMGSGLTVDTGIRDIHYREKNKKVNPSGSMRT